MGIMLKIISIHAKHFTRNISNFLIIFKITIKSVQKWTTIWMKFDRQECAKSLHMMDLFMCMMGKPKYNTVAKNYLKLTFISGCSLHNVAMRKKGFGWQKNSRRWY